MATMEFAGQTFGIYPRVSSLVQGGDDRISLDAQIEACQEYGDELGMVLDAQCVRKESHTATTSERPELEALLRDMITRKVPNLVIDRIDRLTREGQVAAALFLKRFSDANITLHVVSMDLRVRPANASADIKNALDMAFAAEQANKARMHALQRARRAYAKAGRYTLGSRPPYGYQFQIVAHDSRDNPTKYHLIQDTRVLNAQGDTPWTIRQRICREYLAGTGSWTIAQRLTHDGIPTGSMLAKQRGASPCWHASSVREILQSPLNHGAVIAFRHKREEALPDATHTSRWKRVKDAPVDKQIEIPGIVLDPVITPQEAEMIAARMQVGKERSRRNGKQAHLALCHGGMAKCGMIRNDTGEVCGASMHAKTDGKHHRNQGRGDAYIRNGMWYVCRMHEGQPTRCPGVTIAVTTLDRLVWAQVAENLLEPGKFQALAAAQMERDTNAAGETPSTKLQRLQAVRSDFVRRATNLRAAIADTDDAEMREQFLADLQQVNANIRRADADLESQTKLSEDWERKQAIFSNIDYQVARHINKIGQLLVRAGKNALSEADVHDMRVVCESLGVVPTVSVVDDQYEVNVAFNLGVATGAPWFPVADEVDTTIAKGINVTNDVTNAADVVTDGATLNSTS